MTLVVRTVLEHARDFHPAFAPERSPDAVGRRALARYQQAFVRRVIGAGRAQALVPSSHDVALPLADFAAGDPLPAGLLHVSAVTAIPVGAVDAADADPVELTPLARRYAPGRFPAVLLDGDTLRLLGSEQDWTDYATVRLRCILVPDDLPTNDATLAVPDDALDACAGAVASFWAMRLQGLAGLNVNAAEIDGRAKVAENGCLDRLLQQAVAEPFRIRAVR